MKPQYIRLSEQEWLDKHRPITNPRLMAENPDPDFHGWGGQLFDCLDADGAFVLKQLREKPLTVWTLLDCDGKQVIASGFHWVNREGYFVTAVPFQPEAVTEVELDDEDDYDHADCCEAIVLVDKAIDP